MLSSVVVKSSGIIVKWNNIYRNIVISKKKTIQIGAVMFAPPTIDGIDVLGSAGPVSLSRPSQV